MEHFRMEQVREHEDAYYLMMEALDGQLSGAGRRRLEGHLHTCSRCSREWQALMAVDTLLRQAPLLGPAADFTQRTLARLPQRRYRVWLIGAIYGVLLLSGFAPLAAVVWLARLLIPVLNEPALVRSLAQAMADVARVTTVILGTLWQGLDKLGGVLLQQPAFLGSLLLMAGIVFLWSGIYNQLVSARQI
jgi:anti-sigma factor RsiW